MDARPLTPADVFDLRQSILRALAGRTPALIWLPVPVLARIAAAHGGSLDPSTLWSISRQGEAGGEGDYPLTTLQAHAVLKSITRASQVNWSIWMGWEELMRAEVQTEQALAAMRIRSHSTSPIVITGPATGGET